LNASFKAANLLLDRGIVLRRVDKAGEGLQPGDFVVPSATAGVLTDVARMTGVSFAALKAGGLEGTHELKRLRAGMYQRYWGGNIDEGWTRFLLERFSFPYATLMDAEIKKGDLNGK
jgi:hypothetical protein